VPDSLISVIIPDKIDGNVKKQEKDAAEIENSEDV